MRHTKKTYQTIIMVKICLNPDLKKSTIKIAGKLGKLNDKWIFEDNKELLLRCLCMTTVWWISFY